MRMQDRCWRRGAGASCAGRIACASPDATVTTAGRRAFPRRAGGHFAERHPSPPRRLNRCARLAWVDIAAPRASGLSTGSRCPPRRRAALALFRGWLLNAPLAGAQWRAWFDLERRAHGKEDGAAQDVVNGAGVEISGAVRALQGGSAAGPCQRRRYCAALRSYRASGTGVPRAAGAGTISASMSAKGIVAAAFMCAKNSPSSNGLPATCCSCA